MVIDSPHTNDGRRRLHDGYSLVLKMHKDPFLVCPECCCPVTLPVMERAEVSCPTCEARGDKRTFYDGWWPLSERTILDLERGSPKRAAIRRREIDEANAARKKSDDRARLNVLEAIAADYANRACGVLQVGYTKAGTPHAYGSD